MGLLMELGEQQQKLFWELTRIQCRTMQHRHAKPFQQWHGLEPVFLECGNQYILPGPAVAIFPS
jgi:hypothetical protein